MQRQLLIKTIILIIIMIDLISFVDLYSSKVYFSSFKSLKHFRFQNVLNQYIVCFQLEVFATDLLPCLSFAKLSFAIIKLV